MDAQKLLKWEMIAHNCIKTELTKLVTKYMAIMSQIYASEGLNKLDIDQGYQRQADCDKYWHHKND